MIRTSKNTPIVQFWIRQSLLHANHVLNLRFPAYIRSNWTKKIKSSKDTKKNGRVADVRRNVNFIITLGKSKPVRHHTHFLNNSGPDPRFVKKVTQLPGGLLVCLSDSFRDFSWFDDRRLEYVM